MSTFTVNISTDNEAFGNRPGLEIARILREIASKFENGSVDMWHREDGSPYTMFQTILDANGNDVGQFGLKPVDYR